MRLLKITLLMLACTLPAFAEDKGLAVKYPKDLGIAKDPAVVFNDDFEAGKLGATWDEVSRRKVREAKRDVEPLTAETDKTIARGARSLCGPTTQFNRGPSELLSRRNLS